MIRVHLRLWHGPHTGSTLARRRRGPTKSSSWPALGGGRRRLPAIRRRDVVTNSRGSVLVCLAGLLQNRSSEDFPGRFRTVLVDIRVGGGFPTEYVKYGSDRIQALLDLPQRLKKRGGVKEPRQAVNIVLGAIGGAVRSRRPPCVRRQKCRHAQNFQRALS